MKRFLIAATLAFFPLLALGQENQQATLNKKNLVVKEWNTNAKGTTKTLDHLTTYSPEGKKIEEIEYTGKAQKWRKRFEWGENGRQSRELLYDQWNRLVNYKTFEYNAFGKKHIQYTYDSKGRLLSTKLFEYISEDA